MEPANLPDTIPETARESLEPVLAHMYEGKLLADAARAAGIPVGRVLRLQDLYPEARAALARAREIAAEQFAADIASAHEAYANPNTARLYSDNRKYLMERLAPRTYSGKPSGDAEGVASQALAVLQEAIARIPRPPQDPVVIIDAQSLDNKG